MRVRTFVRARARVCTPPPQAYRIGNAAVADGCLGGSSTTSWLLMATEPKVRAAAHTLWHTRTHPRARTHACTLTHARARARAHSHTLRHTTHTRTHARMQVSRWADAYTGKGYATDACGTVDAASLKYSVRAGPQGTLRGPYVLGHNKHMNTCDI